MAKSKPGNKSQTRAPRLKQKPMLWGPRVGGWVPWDDLQRGLGMVEREGRIVAQPPPKEDYAEFNAACVEYGLRFPGRDPHEHVVLFLDGLFQAADGIPALTLLFPVPPDIRRAVLNRVDQWRSRSRTPLRDLLADALDPGGWAGTGNKLPKAVELPDVPDLTYAPGEISQPVTITRNNGYVYTPNYTDAYADAARSFGYQLAGSFDNIVRAAQEKP